MALIPWRERHRTDAPEHPLALLREEMDDLFSRFLGAPWVGSAFELAPAGFDWSPHADFVESDSDFSLRLELPGIKPEDVDIQLADNVLTIRGEKGEEKSDEGKSYHSRERRFGRFVRSVQVPSEVNPEKVDATFRDGVLTVTLEKNPEAQKRTKKISVRTG
jgi:HSP20 family protein